MLEALRAGNPDSLKIPGFSQVEEELADLVIRAMDYAGAHDLALGAAIVAKHAYNVGRPIRHGKEF
jgi:NTP pyrophosphatase (non-canonical NTP hydrolase)